MSTTVAALGGDPFVHLVDPPIKLLDAALSSLGGLKLDKDMSCQGFLEELERAAKECGTDPRMMGILIECYFGRHGIERCGAISGININSAASGENDDAAGTSKSQKEGSYSWSRGDWH